VKISPDLFSKESGHSRTERSLQGVVEGGRFNMGGNCIIQRLSQKPALTRCLSLQRQSHFIHYWMYIIIQYAVCIHYYTVCSLHTFYVSVRETNFFALKSSTCSQVSIPPQNSNHVHKISDRGNFPRLSQLQLKRTLVNRAINVLQYAGWRTQCRKNLWKFNQKIKTSLKALSIHWFRKKNSQIFSEVEKKKSLISENSLRVLQPEYVYNGMHILTQPYGVHTLS
jgi:hypothetical protein